MSEIALSFAGPITHPATTKLRSALCGAALGGVPAQNGQRPTRIYLLLSSQGGNLDDGLSLYNLIRTVNIEVVTVNLGQVASIANVVFLAGEHRVACEESYFHFHDFEWNFPGAHSMDIQNLAFSTDALSAHKALKKTLFKTRTKLTNADFEALKFLEHSLVIDPSTAKKHGIVENIGFPTMPAGTPVVNVEY